jgi:hypothetical protein
MIGVLYRYPHPLDSTKFIYCGQGANRDRRHRSGTSAFGKRFQKRFPNIDLPEPIKEQVEVQDYKHLNWLETVWMFRYHTWRGYSDGMNVLFPGSQDYKNLGKLGGRVNSESGQIHALAKSGIGGRKSKELRVGVFSPNFNLSEAGKKAGQIAVEKGQIQALGREAVKSGQLARITTPETRIKAGKVAGRIRVASGFFSREHQSKVGKIGGKIGGRKNTESGHIQSIGVLGTHARCHVARGVKKDGCRLCYPDL